MSSKTISSITFLCLLFSPFASNVPLADGLAIDQPANQHIQTVNPSDGLSTQEWDHIQRQLKTHRYQAIEQTEGSYSAANIAHGWRIDYGADGRTTLTPHEPEDSDYFISLQLKSLLFSAQGEEQFVSQSFNKEPKLVVSDKYKITYQWNDNVQEIWTNSENRLEQWFEIEQRPEDASQDQQFTLKMALGTDLSVLQNGNTLKFSGGAIADRISYSKLKVWDSTGSEIPARMELQNNILSLVVDDSLAIYPVTVDPSFQQQAYIKASNTEANDQLGAAVAISGDTLVIGASGEDSNATGVDGNETDNSFLSSGAAYVFTRTEGVWGQQAYLKASNTEAGDGFGASVAVSGDTLVIGAVSEGSNATGIDGDENNNSLLFSGAAYVFTRENDTWSQQAYLKASNTGGSDLFGNSVAISGETLVVGALGEASTSTGVNGAEDNDFAGSSGAAYVFKRTEGVWSQQAYLKASNTGAGDEFGRSVAIFGNTVVIGATGERSNATGVDGDETDNSFLFSGAAYVFTRTEEIWSQQAYLKASNTEAEDWFGVSVAISGETLVVAAYREDSNATNVNGDEANNLAVDSGAAYVFGRNQGIWSQQAYLKASNSEGSDLFGWSAAISGETVLVGAPREDSNATSIDGDETNNLGASAGAAYVFTRRAGGWKRKAYVKGSNTQGGDFFAESVAVSNDTLVVGAHFENSNAKGVNGDQLNNTASHSGAVYVFLSDQMFGNSFECIFPCIILPEYDSDPVADSELAFGIVGIGTTSVAKTVTVENRGNIDLTLSCNLTGATPGSFNVAACDTPVNPAGMTELSVECSPQGAGVLSANLVVTTNDLDEGTVSYPLTCTGGSPNPEYDSDPVADSELAFGNVGIGTTSVAKTVTVENRGNIDLTLSCNLTGATPGSFNVAACDTPVNPAGMTELSVECSPLGAGVLSANLVVTTNDLDEGTVSYPLTCTGGSPNPEYDSDPVADSELAFGNVGIGTTSVAKTVTVENRGNIDLTLSCNLTGATPGSFNVAACDTPVNPAGMTELLVECSPLGAGVLSANLVVTTNDLDEGTVSYPLTCTGGSPNPEYDSDPVADSELAFGNVGIGTTSVAKTVTVENRGNIDLTLSCNLTGATPGSFNVAACDTPVNPAGMTELSVECSPQGAGVLSANLVVTTNDLDEGTVSYPLTCTGGSPNPEYDSDPVADSELAFGNVGIGTTSVAKTVTVENRGNIDLTLSCNLTGATPGSFNVAACDTPVNPAGMTELSVECSPQGAGVLSANLVVTTNDLDEGTVSYPLTCTGGSPNPEYDSDPVADSELTFGNVGIGTTSVAKTVTVENRGNIDLTLSCNLTGATPGSFNVAACDTPVNPAGMTELSVECSPQGAGVLSANLVVTTNDLDEGTVSYPLTCTGVTP